MYMSFFFFFREMALQTISESVYVGLCLKIGTPQQVAIRRDAEDTVDLLHHKLKLCAVMMISGSRREGFNFIDSDFDVMFWSKYHRVIWDFSQVTLHNTILCDSSESPPGFTLLLLPLGIANNRVSSSCVRINGSLYISSVALVV